MGDWFENLKEKGKELVEGVSEKISNTTDVVPKELTRLNDNVEKLSKDVDYFKEKVDFDFYKKCIQKLQITLTTIAVLLFVLIIVLIVK